MELHFVLVTASVNLDNCAVQMDVQQAHCAQRRSLWVSAFIFTSNSCGCVNGSGLFTEYAAALITVRLLLLITDIACMALSLQQFLFTAPFNISQRSLFARAKVQKGPIYCSLFPYSPQLDHRLFLFTVTL